MTTRSKRELLDHYASKPVQQFVQLDGFCGVWRDDVMGPDEDGDAIMESNTHELMSTPGEHLPLRLLIHENAHLDDVRRLLEKILANLDGAFDRIERERYRELFERAGVKSEPPF